MRTPLPLESIGIGLVSRIAKRFADERSAGTTTPTPSAMAQRRLEAVTEFIESRLDRSISLIDLAAIAGMSVLNLGRSSKLATGVSPLRHVLIRRVSRAKVMLTQPELSIAQVAFACGFSGQSHLTRVFKQMTGATPAAFRRQASLS